MWYSYTDNGQAPGIRGCDDMDISMISGALLRGGIIGYNENDYGDEEEAGPEGEGSGVQEEAESEGEDPGGGGIAGEGEDHRADPGTGLQGHGVEGASPGPAPADPGGGH